MCARSNNNFSPEPMIYIDPLENSLPLSFTFKVLSLSGVWLPNGWESRKFLKFAYQIFSTISIFAFYVLLGLQIMLLVTSKIDLGFLVDIMFTLLTGLSVCFKITNFLVRRKQVIQLREMLMNDWCVPRDDEERQMQENTDEFVKNFTIGLNFIAQATLLVHLMTPLFQDSSNRKLPFGIWLPCDLHHGSNYWIIYSLEIAPIMFSVLVNATTDVIVSGFVLQACTQLDFLKRRLNQLPDLVRSKAIEGLATEEFQKHSIKQLVVYHDFIIKFIKKVTTTFDVVIVELYVASVLLLSVIIYHLILGEIPFLQKVMAFGYIICMTAELFTYCWCGNEITLKSLDLNDYIYMSNWTALSTKANKALIFIMMRTSRPITMSYGELVVLNIDSFKSIMKITYSAFNLLKESSTS